MQHALAYLAALHGGDEARAARAAALAARWRARSSANEAAWQAAQARWQAVAGLAPQLHAEVRPDETLPARRAARRRWLRRTGGGAGLLGVAALSGWLGLRHWNDTPVYEGDWSTPPRQQLSRIPLPDGSVLALAADGALRATFWRRRREAALVRGHAYFDVAADAQRPWTVHTRLGRVHVLGTAFGISDRGGDIHVSVAHGLVRVSAAGGASRDLAAGQRITLREGHAGEAPALGEVQTLSAATAQDVAAWRDGWWRFTGASLAEVAAEFNAYSTRPLRIAPGAAALALTGSFPIQRPQLLLDALPRALPVRVRPEGEGWWVEPVR
ncbi:MAG: FecR domain-containing protein [Burkholderiaceae bacterium]